MKELTEIKLLADYSDGSPVYELVPAFKMGANRFEIAASPGFAPGIARGDEIELSDTERMGYRVLKRAGNICVQLYLNELNDSIREQLEARVKRIGGILDGGFNSQAGFAAVFSIPISAGFSAIQTLMQQISNEFPLDRWMYGNVYDTKDGVTPLNWWLHETE
jgi:hypothetical protein